MAAMGMDMSGMKGMNMDKSKVDSSGMAAPKGEMKGMGQHSAHTMQQHPNGRRNDPLQKPQ